MMEKRYHDFNATAVPLEGSNLIEASAGTGKTYSIAILVLRLILEKQLSIKDILMVTFTQAAVAELADRIRLFVRKAYAASQDQDPQDGKIESLVQAAIEQWGATAIHQRLRDAVLLLDETAILTIHSFCQQTLNEFAFETDQLFGAEMVPDTTPIIESELNKFWRKHVTTLHPAILQLIWQESMRDNIQMILKEHLDGKRYLGYQSGAHYEISPEQQQDWLDDLDKIKQQQTALETKRLAYIADNYDSLMALCQSNGNARRYILPYADSPEKFAEIVNEKQGTDYVKKLFPEIVEMIAARNVFDTQFDEHKNTLRRQLNYLAIQEVAEGVKAYKQYSNMLNYDDLISHLNQALVQRENTRLVDNLQKKYKAVFIDEFQDTDRQQYEIFNRAFGENTILFYIGDPKQSIYAWRKADIYTYFEARNSVQHLYSMNHNFRSSENLIDAMNVFFKPTADFDTFEFTGERDSIQYFEVMSPENNSKGFLYHGEEKEIPITIFHSTKKEAINSAVAAQVAQLLVDRSYQIIKGNEKRAITPSDIGILVRTGKEGKMIKQELAQLGIPAVTIDETKVLNTAEAIDVLYLLEAMETPERSTINRALLSPFTGFTVQDILNLDDELSLTRFGEYQRQWQNNGAYTALMQFIAEFDVRNVLLGNHSKNGERIITNLYQLAELVHQVQNRKNLSMRDLIAWLKRGIDGMLVEGDEYVQRVESDEEAVNIVTIHKSKGLDYRIVFAPHLDFQGGNYNYLSFRDPDTGDYINAEKDRVTPEQQEAQRKQQVQEDRRLIYVAITRAIYKCYLFRNNSSKLKDTSFSKFVKALEVYHPHSPFISIKEDLPQAPEQPYRKSKLPTRKAGNAPVSFYLQEENWRKMSYTMLAAKPEQKPRIRSAQQEDEYDNFIFNTLRKGAKTGNLLHFIFENVNFSDNSQWEYWIKEAIARFVPGQEEIYLPMLQQLLQHVMHTQIKVGKTSFQLASVGKHKRLAELEFDFPVPLFRANMLNTLSDNELTVSVKRFSEDRNQELEGIMNGKIDLFFEHNHRYYILDWKSNYLGGSTADYTPAALAAAMNENNYHLQYLIYTVAVKKYLESRLPEFDYHKHFGGVVYCFVRGIRNNGDYGIFTARPDIDTITFIEDMLTAKSHRY
ncbi:exodeoxyribonuclease V subunit beta [Chitinophaga qingshengii]|uniref:RecBCD enzyme subunit RecB n=1 Tax=Chitinophaga qingshengii TaxID=1569794 RepID=A0ABR7TPA7_9BACT|nr:exodeoxyribonuclease V subunit beta [Chitinophaga qingshengii]MBC9931480.1 exodeoxyribonuclease V subunit beta [Chitinophaga qingshengii]